MAPHAPETEHLLQDSGGCDVRGLFLKIYAGVLGALLALVIVVPLLHWTYQWSLDESKRPEYSVTVAGFSGLDPDRDLLAPALDSTFDLTLRIKEPRKYSAACVDTATVSYRVVQLARGPVPGFCGRSESTTEERNVMAWGSAVTVPQFSRDRLAEELRRGEATVDMTLVSPPKYCQYCFQTVIQCMPRLGRGDPSPPCLVRTRYPHLPDEGTTGQPQPARRMLRFVGKQ